MGCGCCSHASTEQDILRVAIFGLENSGKTSLVQCLKSSTKIPDNFQSISTHGVVAVNVHLNIQIHMNLLIFDCGGCKHQRHIWPHLVNNSELILFTVDSLDLFCLEDAKQALFDLLTDESLIDKPLLVVFTKSDQRQQKTLRELEQELDLFMIQDRPIHRVLFSAVTLDGLTSISAWLAYFSHCKQQGKEFKVPPNSQSSSKKYQIPKLLNLSRASTVSLTTMNPSRTSRSASKYQTTTRTSSSSSSSKTQKKKSSRKSNKNK